MRNNLSFKAITNWFVAKPKQLFGVDAVGAAVTAFLIGVVLVKFQVHFGMPVFVLKFLAAIALLFFVYSSCCFLFLKDDFKPYLKAITRGNLTYCFITAALLFYYSKQLTTLGFVYFINEIAIIIALVVVERRVCKLL